MSVITLTTDFGSDGIYPAAMKGVILSIDPRATIVDVTHDVPPQNVRAGALALADVADCFPTGTIHVAVVDPGVGTDRAILCAKIADRYFIAPDNGLLSFVAARQAPEQIVKLTEPRYWREKVSSTFHGRDIIAPVAAHLSLGVTLDDIGTPVEAFITLPQPRLVVSQNRIEGMILEIDPFGNVITNITDDLLAGRPTDERVCVVCNIYETWGVYSAYGEQVQGALCALVGSNGRLELAIVGGNAAERLGFRVGMPVTLAWNE